MRETLHRVVDALPAAALAHAAERLEELSARQDFRAQALIERWIRAHPDKPGPGDAVLAESYVPVYAVIGALPEVPAIGQGIDAAMAQVADDYEVPSEAVEAAVAFYRRHREAVDARIYTGEPSPAPSHGENHASKRVRDSVSGSE